MKRRIHWKRLVPACLAIALLAFMLRWFEYTQVYHPSRNLTATGAELGRPFENVFFEASDGAKLNGWYFRANSAASNAPATVLVCHGNAGNISHRLELCSVLLEAGLNVFVFDYRGYGRSTGRPSEAGTYLDAVAAYQWLERKGCDRIIVYGESLGGGVAAELCLRESAAGLVLQSTFTSIPDIGAELFPWLPVRWLARIRYETLNKLPRIKVPVLVMHSRTDGLIPFLHAERNFAAANEPKLLCEIRGDHNDALLDPGPFRAGMQNFLRLLEGKMMRANLGELKEVR